MNRKDSKLAAIAYKAHLETVNTLLLDTMNPSSGLGAMTRLARPGATWGDLGRRGATWGDVGTMAHAPELAAQLAWTLGAITAGDAKARHGVTL
jgi:hypothetical protein